MYSYKDVMTDKQKLIWKILDMLYQEDGEAVRHWIYHKFPHGYGLYD